MNTKNRVHKDSAEKAVRDIRRATRRLYVVRTYWTGLDLIQEIVPSIN